MTDAVTTATHPGWTEIGLSCPGRLNVSNDDMNSRLTSTIHAEGVEAFLEKCQPHFSGQN